MMTPSKYIKSDSKLPLVSICIPTYNAETTVRRTLNSILNQTYKNFEIVIVDNASRDSTLEIVNSYHDPRIRIIKNDHNIGAENNWSKCIEEARGEYIAIFHADDTYFPIIIEKEVEQFIEDPGLGAVFTSAYFINEHDEIVGAHALPREILKNHELAFKNAFLLLLEHWNFFLCPSALVKANIYKTLTPFRYEKFRTSSDLDMWLRILEQYRVVVLSDKLMNYRISATQGNYLYNLLRTEKADFLEVMDYYLACYQGKIRIPMEVLYKYKLFKLSDEISIIHSNLLLNNKKEGLKLLKKVISLSSLIIIMENFYRPNTILDLIVNPFFLIIKDIVLKGSIPKTTIK